MRLRKIIKLFNEGNVAVCGLKGRGKDMLMANVAIRRKQRYISNIDYGGEYMPLEPTKMSVGGNTFKEFIKGNIKPYEYPYEDNIDIYISDVGVYFPAQYNGELNKDFREFPIFMALSRQLGECNVHYNVQNLNRAWDKLREMSDTYILCNKCIYIKWLRLVIQKVTIYDYAESALRRLKPLKLPNVPLLAKNRRELEMHKETAKANHEASHGTIKSGWLIYRNKSNYNTRIFKEILKGETKNEENNCYIVDSNNVI